MSDRERTHFKARMLAFALLLFNATAALLSAGNCFTGTLASFGIPDAWKTFLFTILACILFLGAFLLVARAWNFDITRFLSKPLIVVINAVGSVLFVLIILASTYALDAAVRIILSASGAVLTVGCATQFIAWSRAFGTIPIRDTVVYIGLSAAIASLAAIIVISFSSSIVMIIALSISPILAAILMPSSRIEASEGGENIQEETASLHEEKEESPSDTASSLNRFALRELWPIFVGICVCMVVLISMWRSAADVETLTAASLITQGIFFGFIFCAAVLAACAVMLPDKSRLSQLAIWLCPVFAALPLVPCIVPANPNGVVGFFLGACTGLGLAYFLTLPLSLLYRKTRGELKGMQAIWGLTMLSIGVGGFTGALLSVFTDVDQTTAVSASLFIAYLVALAVVPRKHTGAETAALADNSPLPDPIDKRCSLVSESASLTPRESEVFTYLARGRSTSYIAKEMYVSPETVKVHVKHIYEKLDVHSRQELLDLIQTK